LRKRPGANRGEQVRDQVFTEPRRFVTQIDLFGIAAAGGLYIVPVFAAVQAWAGAAFRARTIAAVNILNAAFMTGSTVIVAVLQSLGATMPVLFIGLGVLNLIVAAIIWRTMPKA